MSTRLKILIAISILQWFEVSGNPLFQGLSFQRGFEINLKPFPKKTFEFIKEKWSPFGVFGRKFAIQKRSLDDMIPPRLPRPAAPVFEHIDEIEQFGTAPLFIVPRPPVKPSIPPPIETPKPPAPIPPPPPPPPPFPVMINGLPPLPVNPNIVPPISTNMVIIHPTKLVANHVPESALYTDISKVESVKEHLNTAKPPPPVVPPVPVPLIQQPLPAPIAQPLIVPVAPPPIVPVPPTPVAPVLPPPVAPVPKPPVAPPPPPPVVPVPLVVPPKPPVAPISPIPAPPVPPVPPKTPVPPLPIPIKEENKVHLPPTLVAKKEILLKDSSLVRGSKMALQFGTMFLTLMAQFFDNARASIDLMTNPPPTFKP